ncbi:MAG TPA: GntR family transcriptional regulator [Patescibacteria group bacterium]|nr:GntR family transcriptional regulator [Patescibacteria group bacterium]
MSIDHASPVPLRAQVEDLLRNLARRPEYQNGALLPDELSLAAQLAVSRGTIRAGISKLVFEGVFQRKPGVGTRVARHVESGIRAWRSLTREMEAKGITVENFRLDFCRVNATPSAAAALQLTPGTPLWRLDRVRGWEAKPVLHSVSWFHPRVGLTGTEDFNRPLYEVMEQATGVRPHRAQEEFLAVRAERETARLLQVPAGTALLLRRHTVLDVGRRPIEFAEVRYVSDRFTLTLDMRRGEE